MQESLDHMVPPATPEPESFHRLLAALGAWGAAEERGDSKKVLETLETQAFAAFQAAVTAA